jgi:hypothetical protein
MYNITPLRTPDLSLSGTPKQPFNLWLWLAIGAAAYFLLRKEKKPNLVSPSNEERTSQTPSDLHGLGGSLRTCDAWFETEDKRGFKTHRCFIYKPACNTKRCKADTNVSRETISEMQGYDFDLGYTKNTKIDLEPLTEEARNYSNPEEFADAFYGRGRIMSPSGEYHSARVSRISQIDNEYNPKLVQFIKEYPYEAEKIPGLNKLTGNEKTVTIYRSATGNIRPGDWVALSSEYAKGHSRTKSHRLYKMQVPVSDIRWAGTSAEEWFYAPQSAIKEFKNFDPKQFYDDVIKGNLKGFAGYTATCRTFKRNKLGRRYCAKYAPTCGSAEEGCRSEPAPVPGARKPKESKEFIPMDDVVKQIAKDMAWEYNERLDGVRELMRKIKKYGGIAPYGGGYLKEEYKDIPTKYKSADGIKLDELASEIGFKDERSLVDAINASEDEFNEMKAMQGGRIIRKFKTDDFLTPAYDRLIEEHGYTFSGIGNAAIQKANNWAERKPSSLVAYEYEYIKSKRAGGVPDESIYKQMSINEKNLPLIGQKDVTEFLNSLIMYYDRRFGNSPQIKIINKKYGQKGQMTLFGLSNKQLRNITRLSA